MTTLDYVGAAIAILAGWYLILLVATWEREDNQ